MNKQTKWYIIFLMLTSILTYFNYTIANKNNSSMSHINEVINYVNGYYVRETVTEELVDNALIGMVEKLDKHSTYIPQSDVKAFGKMTHGAYEGIGIVIGESEHYISVVSPIEDSPAFKAGMKPGDLIIEVEGESTHSWSSDKAVSELTGKSGSDVKLKVLHHDDSEQDFVITRGQIQMEIVKGWRRNSVTGRWDYMLDSENKIGFIRLTQFTDSAVTAFDKAIKGILAKGATALILDLRNNPGGLLSVAIQFVDRFIDSGVIVSMRGAHTEAHKKYATAKATTMPNIRVVILMNQFSASASEIVAGALQDHNRAIVIGRRSYGKGSVQRTIEISSNGSMLKLTTDYYYLPNGRCVHRIEDSDEWGVEPDFEIKIKPLQLKNLDDEDYRKRFSQLINQMTIEALKGVLDVENTDLEGELLQQRNAHDTEQKEKLLTEYLTLDAQMAQAVEFCQEIINE
jgi:carboxyl-terminal processing protease